MFSPEGRARFRQQHHSHPEFALREGGTLDAASTLGGVSGSSLASAFGAWTSYTPTLAQGASTNISKTVNYAKYVAVGKLIICQIKVTPTAGGSAGSAITLSLPVTAASSGFPAGAGTYNDNGTVYRGLVYLNSTTVVGIDYAGSTAGGLIGANPNIAVASSGDTMSVSLMYEAA